MGPELIMVPSNPLTVKNVTGGIGGAGEGASNATQKKGSGVGVLIISASLRNPIPPPPQPTKKIITARTIPSQKRSEGKLNLEKEFLRNFTSFLR